MAREILGRRRDHDNEVTGATRRRVLISGVVGNVLEWYDFALYGYLAPIIATLFFPSSDPLTSLINTFAVFALGSLARPVGGIIFGHVGDRYGRRMLLTLSVAMMAAPTTLIGILPTYEQAGVWAPVLLCVLRLLQGLSTGGEFIGSITFLAEHAPASRRGFYSSFANSGAMIGGLLGAGVGWLVTAFVPMDLMHDWGWRVPFLSGILVGICGLWIRVRMPDSPVYVKLKSEDAVERRPLHNAFRVHWRGMALTFGLNWVVSAGYYVVFVWFVTDLTKVIGLTYHMALGIGTLGLLAGLVLTPAMGYLSDLFGRRLMLIIAALATVAGAIPLLILAGMGSVVAAAGAQFGLAVLMAAFLGTLPAVFVSLFGASLRCSGLAIGYNLAPAIFGGTAPLVATLLIKWSGWAPAPGLYLAATALVLLTLVKFVPAADSEDDGIEGTPN